MQRLAPLGFPLASLVWKAFSDLPNKWYETSSKNDKPRNQRNQKPMLQSQAKRDCNRRIGLSPMSIFARVMGDSYLSSPGFEENIKPYFVHFVKTTVETRNCLPVFRRSPLHPPHRNPLLNQSSPQSHNCRKTCQEYHRSADSNLNHRYLLRHPR